MRRATVVRDRSEFVLFLRDASVPEPSEPSGLVLLCSGDAVPPPGLLDSLASSSPAFAEVLENVRPGQDPARSVLCLHLGLQAALRDLGITESAVLGSGVGNLSVRVIKGELDLDEAVRGAGELAPSTELDADRLTSALEALSAHSPVLLELGADGVLSRTIGRMFPGAVPVRLAVTDPRDDASILQCVARLYQEGVQIDWDRHYGGRRPRRIPMPPTAFDDVRCWCREPGDVFSWGADSAPAPPPVEAEPPVSGSFATGDERKVARIWREALKMDIPDACADYFELGGTSIAGIAVLDGVEREFGVRISFAEIYDHSVLGSLAARIRELASDGSAPARLEPIPRIPRDGPLPISLGQEQIWFLDQLHPGTPLYNIPFDLHLHGELDVEALRLSIRELIARHELLRTSFISVDGQPRARIEPVPDLQLPVEDLSGFPEAERLEAALHRHEQEATEPFRLDEGPLVRCVLMRLGPREHVLLMTIHHIVFDGWTPAIIHDELSRCYRAFLAGQTPDLPELPIQYADFAAWQRRQMSGENLEHELAFWREHLCDAPDLLLPTDFPRPAVQSYRGEMLNFEVPEDVATALRASGQTMFGTMMAAFAILLQRYSGQDDMVVGTPAAGRRHPDTRGLVGYFNNMLALRTDLSGDPTFRELSRRVAKAAAEAVDHEDVPFEKVVDALSPRRDLSRNPVFQVAYTHQNTPYRDYDLPGLEVDNFAPGSIRGIAPGTAKFDLTIGLSDQTQGPLEGYLEYATDLFERASMDRLLEQFHALLRSIVASPDVPISRLEMSADDERCLLLDEWGRGARAREFVPVHELIARADPSRTAIVSVDELFTYGDLCARASALARCLRDHGTGPESVVAVCMPRVPDAVVAQVAALWAGCAFLPLDPAHPPDRLRFMVRDARAAVVVTTPELAASVRDAGAEVMVLDEVPRDHPVGRPAPVTPDQAAYVIYTSGSTGTPKGSVVTHGGLSNLASWFESEWGPGESMSHLAGQSFDASVFEVFPALAAGYALHLVPDDVRIDPDALKDWLRALGIVRAFAPTPVALALLDLHPHDLGVRTLFAGGDRLLTAPPPGAPEVVNLYGPSECSPVSTAARVPPRDPDRPAREPSIGRPIAGARAYVLDALGRLAPAGVPGELYVAGAGVGRGYIGRPGLTAERFVPDQFADLPGSRMYRTGDLARWRADGTLEFLGRVDDQVKVRGVRVEPGEIAAELSRHPDAGQAVVVALGPPGPTRLVAYVTGTASHADLKAFLARRLPAAMVPSAFVTLDRLPLTANGKVDRKSLPAPQQQAASAPVAGLHVPPRPGAEQVLAGIWSKVLDVAKVGAGDNFFELGGDSILSIQVVARAARAGLKLTPRQMFEYQTLSELAAAAVAVSRPAVRTQAAGPVPLTPIQRWLLERDDLDVHYFNQAVLLDVPPEYGPYVQDAVAAVVACHDVLRASFRRTAFGWRQEIHPDVPSDLEIRKEVPDPADLEAECDAVQASLDIESGRIVRAGFFLVPGGARLLLAVHHLAVDAVSWGPLLDDLASAFEQASRGGSIQLVPANTSFAQWARLLSDWATSDEVASELDHWLLLEDYDVAPLPRDRAEGRNDESSADTVTLELSEQESADALSAFGARPPEILLAALAMAAGRPLLVDVEGHGRHDLFEDADLSGTVGWFTTVYPVAVAPGADEREALRSAKDALRRVPTGGVGYMVLRHLSPDTPDVRRLRALPRPDVLFNYLGSSGDGGPLPMAPEEPGAVRSPGAGRSHVLEVEASVHERRLEVVFRYSRNLHDESSVRGIATSFERALRALGESGRDRTAPAPSDFPLARIGQQSVDRYLSSPDVQDAYPLSPMQHGLLFHSLYAPESGVYFEQLHFICEGEVDEDRLESAWQLVASRHPALRTSVVWEGLDEPLQVVHRDCALPVERGADIDSFLSQDRLRGFDPSQPPLIRLGLIRESDSRLHMVVSHHHLVMDGWSLQLVLDEVWQAYLGRESELPPVRPYSDFIAWLRGRDTSAERRWWRESLAGFRQPATMIVPAPECPRPGYDKVTRVVPEEPVREFARRNRLTVNTVVQGAWAAVCARYGRCHDVVFGATVSGRPPELPGSGEMVGLFVNTVPVRVRIPAVGSIVQWLSSLQNEQARARQHEHTPLVEVQSASEVPRRAPLFETIVGFENYPEEDDSEDALGFTVRTGEYVEQTNYPLTLVVAPGAGIELRIAFDTSRFDAASAGQIMDHLATAIDEIVNSPEAGPRELGVLADAGDFVGADDGPGAFVHRAFEHVEPRSPTERLLASIWRDVLGLDRVGVTDDFFELGGHSLLATQVLSRVRATFQVPLSLRALFDAPTVQRLADEIALLWGSAEVADEVARTVMGVEEMSEDEVRAMLGELESR
ncbi:MAG TPA: amino acid adenylation domain-containing protein [Actinomycetota bacterium]|nr:amino acid adenylation domain-containing protein [Actinomycetota bacterium]